MLPRLDVDTPAGEFGGRDPLDSTVAPAQRAPGSGRLAFPLRNRVALGLAPALAPMFLFVSLGWLLGPSALRILTPRVLGHLELAVSIALATLGVLVGVGLEIRTRADRTLLGLATLEAAMTMSAVSCVVWALLEMWGLQTALPHGVLAMALGIAASASGGTDAPGSHVHRDSGRVADLDDLLPVVAGGLLIAWTADPGWTALVRGLTWSVLLGAMLAAAGWLLFTSTESREEQAVYLLGLVLLLGGTASSLGLSPLLVGVIAGVMWSYAPGHVDLIASEYLGRVQHPLVLLLVLTAGASAAAPVPLVWLVLPFVLVRLAAKLAGGRLAVPPGSSALFLLSPGVIGLAFVLNLHQALPDARGAAVLGIVAIGLVITELVALLTWPARIRHS